MNGPVERLPHAALDLSTRRAKARKIAKLLGIDGPGPALRLLEIGTGSGAIAHYFGTHGERQFAVEAVDVKDNRVVEEGYQFQRVEDTKLPFNDRTFDVVVSNHVIEHVGDNAAQRRHLAEIKRVLAEDGVGYLAVPNRWMLVEPHYKLAFLSWLPPFLRTRYLQLMRRGTEYDCHPMELRELHRALADTKLDWHHLEIEAIREMRSSSSSGRLISVIAAAPFLVRLLLPLMPTLICRVTRAPHGE